MDSLRQKVWDENGAWGCRSPWVVEMVYLIIPSHLAFALFFLSQQRGSPLSPPSFLPSFYCIDQNTRPKLGPRLKHLAQAKMDSDFTDWDALSDESYPLGKTPNPLLAHSASLHELLLMNNRANLLRG